MLPLTIPLDTLTEYVRYNFSKGDMINYSKLDQNDNYNNFSQSELVEEFSLKSSELWKILSNLLIFKVLQINNPVHSSLKDVQKLHHKLLDFKR